MAFAMMTCWECQQPAPGGVCARPHPKYSHYLARSRGYVIDPNIHAVLTVPSREWALRSVTPTPNKDGTLKGLYAPRATVRERLTA